MGRKNDRHARPAATRKVVHVCGQSILMGNRSDSLPPELVPDFLELCSRNFSRYYGQGWQHNPTMEYPDQELENSIKDPALRACLRAAGLTPSSISDHRKQMEQSR